MDIVQILIWVGEFNWTPDGVLKWVKEIFVGFPGNPDNFNWLLEILKDIDERCSPILLDMGDRCTGSK